MACSIWRSYQPRRPKARTCCFLSSLKTLAMPTESTNPRAGVNVPEVIFVGRFSGDHRGKHKTGAIDIDLEFEGFAPRLVWSLANAFRSV